MKRKTHEEFVAEMAAKHPDIEVVGTYTGARDPVACRCRKCGHEWSPMATNLLSGRGCPDCAGHKKKTHEEFVAEIAAKHPDIEVVGSYTMIDNRVACRCRKCGHEWSPWAGNLLRGRGCPKCAGRIKTHEEFVAEMQSINKNVEVLSLYETAATKLRCRCRLCGNTWDATPNALLRGSGCPACSHTATSFMEQFVLISLRKVLGDSRVLSRDTDRIGKELDILIPDYDYAIEMGSWFWHKSKLDDDNKKKQLCIDAGITLLTVYDDCDESVSPDDYTLIYPFDLAKEKGFSGLKQIVTRALKDIDENKDLTDADWENIKEAAHLSSRKRTTEEFVEALKIINPDIQVLGEYRGSGIKIACICRKCGHEWSPTPNGLLRGTGCPKCAGRVKKTQEEFVAEMAAKNPDIEVVGTYTRKLERVACRCRKCGHEWSPRADHLLSGHGCPKCAGNARKTHKEFVAEITAKHPNIEVVGTYTGAQNRVACRCKKCGHEWSPTPNGLLRGTGCPKCVGRVKKTHKEFVAEMAAKNPDIEVIGTYTTTTDPIACRCKKCGYEWSPMPNNLLRGTGCPKCAGGAKKTHEDFVAEMAAKNPDIEVIGTYTTTKNPIACICRKCGHEWSPTPNNLLSGRGCPKCAGRVKKTQEEFVAEMAAKHPNIEVVGTYTRERDRVACRCRKCGHEWSPLANNLSSGHGCPKCAGNARKTHKEFVAEITAKHPNIEVVGTYTGAQNRVACRCKKCGHEWSPLAGKLSAGVGCPGCKALTASKRLRKTHEKFVAEMAAKNPDIEVVGTYTGARDPIACRCRKCGHEWSPMATNLLSGKGCPDCAGKK